MTESQLNLGNYLLGVIKNLESRRQNYKDAFDRTCELHKMAKRKTPLKKFAKFSMLSLEKRIIELDGSIEFYKQKFHQL